MSMNDPIADLLTRIRNGQAAGKPEVRVQSSRVRGSPAALITASSSGWHPAQSRTKRRFVSPSGRSASQSDVVRVVSAAPARAMLPVVARAVPPVAGHRNASVAGSATRTRRTRSFIGTSAAGGDRGTRESAGTTLACDSTFNYPVAPHGPRPPSSSVARARRGRRSPRAGGRRRPGRDAAAAIGAAAGRTPRAARPPAPGRRADRARSRAPRRGARGERPGRSRARDVHLQAAAGAARRGTRAHRHDRARQDARRVARERAAGDRVRGGRLRRAVDRASTRCATFTHATSSSKPTPQNSTNIGVATLPTTSSCSVVMRGRQPFRSGYSDGYCALTAAPYSASRACACSRVMPGCSRAKAPGSRRRPRLPGGGRNSAGLQTSTSPCAVRPG